jgi:hypothetical protein
MINEAPDERQTHFGPEDEIAFIFGYRHARTPSMVSGRVATRIYRRFAAVVIDDRY